MNGNRAHDSRLADTSAGFVDENGRPINGGRPAEYTWHHHEDTQTMMLVPSITLNNFIGDWTNGVPHTGGAAILNNNQ